MHMEQKDDLNRPTKEDTERRIKRGRQLLRVSARAKPCSIALATSPNSLKQRWEMQIQRNRGEGELGKTRNGRG